MSDNWIRLIPQDPYYVPDVSLITIALEKFKAVAPKSDGIEFEITDGIRFIDCGANFETISCPTCRREISMNWWQDRMTEDWDGLTFKLNKYRLPCCGNQNDLNELSYGWAVGFGRFNLEAINPGIGLLNVQYKEEFERILQTPLRVIYQHL